MFESLRRFRNEVTVFVIPMTDEAAKEQLLCNNNIGKDVTIFFLSALSTYLTQKLDILVKIIYFSHYRYSLPLSTTLYLSQLPSNHTVKVAILELCYCNHWCWRTLMLGSQCIVTEV